MTGLNCRRFARRVVYLKWTLAYMLPACLNCLRIHVTGLHMIVVVDKPWLNIAYFFLIWQTLEISLHRLFVILDLC